MLGNLRACKPSSAIFTYKESRWCWFFCCLAFALWLKDLCLPAEVEPLFQHTLNALREATRMKYFPESEPYWNNDKFCLPQGQMISCYLFSISSGLPLPSKSCHLPWVFGCIMVMSSLICSLGLNKAKWGKLYCCLCALINVFLHVPQLMRDCSGCRWAENGSFSVREILCSKCYEPAQAIPGMCCVGWDL